MRTDCTIDHKQVICRFASFTGYSTRKAQLGHIIRWNDVNGQSYTGRVMGRIVYAPKLESTGFAIKNWLLVAYLAPDLSYVGERWVNPDWVTSCEPVGSKRAEVANYFLGEDIVKTSRTNMEELRICLSDMWSSLKRYREWKATR
jgi:hypothetical protein